MITIGTSIEEHMKAAAALNAIRPDASWSIRSDGLLLWMDSAQAVPTPEAFEAAVFTTNLDKMGAEAVQAHLDQTAKLRGYWDANSIVSYALSTNATYAAEAASFIEWRDAVWLAAFSILAQVKAGTRAVPTPGQLLLELPTIVWPSP